MCKNLSISLSISPLSSYPSLSLLSFLSLSPSLFQKATCITLRYIYIERESEREFRPTLGFRVQIQIMVYRVYKQIRA